MTLQLRRALALFFICLFAIVAPSALAYARGYRFDFSTRSLRQTGVIFLQGEPRDVLLRLDGQAEKPTRFPKTYHSITPGIHVLRISAMGYTPQEVSVNVLPGRTSHLTNLQLIQENPLHTVKTAIPATARLAPTGVAAAWMQTNQVVITTQEKTVKSPPITNLGSIVWAGNAIEVFNGEGKFLGIVTLSGAYSPTEKRVQQSDKALTTLVEKTGLTYNHAQRIDELHAWLLSNAEGAWFLEDTGATSIVTRWADTPIAAKMVSRTVLAVIRKDGVTLRNLITNHSVTFAQPGIVGIAEAPAKGTLHLLVQDGDLRSWIRADFF